MNAKKEFQIQKVRIMKELARLEGMNWAADDAVAESIFPYVLVEALNILKNSEIVDSPIDYASTGGYKELLTAPTKTNP